MPRYPTKVVPFSATSTYFVSNVATLTDPAFDLFMIQGSATRKIIVLGMKIVLNIPADATISEYMFLVRRSSQGTGGVKTANFNSFPLDRSGEVATASVFGFTTSPDPVGTFVHNIDLQPTAGLAAASPQDPHDAQSLLTIPFTIPNDISGITLDGVNDFLAVGFASGGRAVASGGVLFWGGAYWLEVINT